MDSTQASIITDPCVPITPHAMFYCNIRAFYNNVVSNYEQMQLVISQTQLCNMQMAQEIAFLRNELFEKRNSTDFEKESALKKFSYEKEERDEEVEIIFSDVNLAFDATDLRLSEISDVFTLTLLKKDVEINSLKFQLSGVERDCEVRLNAKDQEIEFHREAGNKCEGLLRGQCRIVGEKTKEVEALNAKVGALEAGLRKAGSIEDSKFVKLQGEYRAAVDHLAAVKVRAVDRDEKISNLVVNLSLCEDRVTSLQADSKKQGEALKNAQDEVISLSLAHDNKNSLCALKDEELEAKDNLLAIKDKELKALRSSEKAALAFVPTPSPVVVEGVAALKVVVFKKDNRDKIIAHLRSQVQTLATFVKSNISIITSAVPPLEKSVKAMIKKTKALGQMGEDTFSKIRLVIRSMDLAPTIMTAEMKTDLAKLHRFIETKFESTELDPNTKIAFKRLDAQKLGEMLGLMIRRINDVKSEMEVVRMENQKLGLAMKFTVHLHTQCLIGVLQDKIEKGGEGSADLAQFLKLLRELLVENRIEMQERVSLDLQKFLSDRGIQGILEEKQ